MKDNKKKTGRPGKKRLYPPTPENKALIRGFVISGYNKTEICACLGIGYNTLMRDFRDEIENGKMRVVNMVVSKLFEKIKDGDLNAITFYLNKQVWTKEDKKETSININNNNEVINSPLSLTKEQFDQMTKEFDDL